MDCRLKVRLHSNTLCGGLRRRHCSRRRLPSAVFPRSCVFHPRGCVDSVSLCVDTLQYIGDALNFYVSTHEEERCGEMLRKFSANCTNT
ncbi:hypothetical protein Taro_011790 [Colocasia esculenta]|uniref:Uncharacterized protein n=1 Tax=Colocasia esculenta TaxID=4460 RepID=A0A843UDP1_COLES|nr:hypothetical protein [Colocasia esculenta]